MDNLNTHISKYRAQLKNGHIQKAYLGIITGITQFRNQLQKNYPEYQISNQMQNGFMDMTYFAFSPPELRQQKLKIALVFNHQDFQFEFWLVGQNKKVQKNYWTIFKESDWKVYPLSSDPNHAIVQYVFLNEPNFEEEEDLKDRLESGLIKFTESIIQIFG